MRGVTISARLSVHPSAWRWHDGGERWQGEDGWWPMDDVGTRGRRWRRHHAATICRMPAADGRCCGQGRRGQGIAGLWGRGWRKAAWQGCWRSCLPGRGMIVPIC